MSLSTSVPWYIWNIVDLCVVSILNIIILNSNIRMFSSFDTYMTFFGREHKRDIAHTCFHWFTRLCIRCKKLLEACKFLRYLKSFVLKFHVFHNNAITVQRATCYATKDPKCHKSMCSSIWLINIIQLLLNISSWKLLTASCKFYYFRVKLVLHTEIRLSKV